MCGILQAAAAKIQRMYRMRLRQGARLAGVFGGPESEHGQTQGSGTNHACTVFTYRPLDI